MTDDAAISFGPPEVRIGPHRPATPIRELWGSRELLFFLASRDVKVRYKQTVLGVAWALLQPLLTMVAFTLLFGKLGNMPSENLPYSLFTYAALLPWTFFSTAVLSAATSFTSNADLLTKVYVPRLIIPAAVIAAHLVDFSIAFSLLVPLMIFHHTPLSAEILLLPLLVAVVTVLALAVGLWLAALNVKYRDIRYVVPFAMQMWLFFSPVIYPSRLVPERVRPLLMLNPLTGIIEGFRSSLFGRPVDWIALGVSVVVTILILSYALRVYHRMEQSFADVV